MVYLFFTHCLTFFTLRNCEGILLYMSSVCCLVSVRVCPFSSVSPVSSVSVFE